MLWNGELKKMKGFKKITGAIVVCFILLTWTSCKKDKFFHVDFKVVNETAGDLQVDYSVRICTGVNSGCQYEAFTDFLDEDTSRDLFVSDDIAENAEIKEMFGYLDIYQGVTFSTFDFWNSSALTQTKEGDTYKYVLTVDPTFFE
jgi:hypothetical protein